MFRKSPPSVEATVQQLREEVRELRERIQALEAAMMGNLPPQY
jgi:hypothetical protein